jgi:hypothetical protein
MTTRLEQAYDIARRLEDVLTDWHGYSDPRPVILALTHELLDTTRKPESDKGENS